MFDGERKIADHAMMTEHVGISHSGQDKPGTCAEEGKGKLTDIQVLVNRYLKESLTGLYTRIETVP